MSPEKPNDYEQAANRYLDEVADRYIMDRSSGIYKPKTEHTDKNTQSNSCGPDKSRPFWVNIVRDWPVFLVSIGTFLLLGFTVHYARKQWFEANRSAAANELSAQRAFETLGQIKDQTLLARQQISGTFGAIVPAELPRPSPFSKDLEMLHWQGLYVYFDNIGKVPANHFFAEGTFVREMFPNYRVIGFTQHSEITAYHVRPVSDTIPGISGLIRDERHLSFDTSRLTAEDIKRLNGLEEVVEVRGHSEYENGFGNIIHQPFCFLYAVLPRHIFSNSGASTGSGEGAWGFCDDMRHYIAEAQKWQTEDSNPK